MAVKAGPNAGLMQEVVYMRMHRTCNQPSLLPVTRHPPSQEEHDDTGRWRGWWRVNNHRHNNKMRALPRKEGTPSVGLGCE